MKLIKIGNLKELFSSLRIQLLLYFTLVSLVVMAIGSYVVYKSIFNILKQRNEKNVIQQFKQVDYNFNNFMNEVDSLSKLFLTDEVTQNFLKAKYLPQTVDSSNAYREINSKISNYILNYPYINSLYIYTDDLKQYGSSYYRVKSIEANSEAKKVYDSGMYSIAIDNFPKIYWTGGNNESFFDEDIKNSSIKLISAIRAVKPLNETKIKAVIAINIDERFLSSLYSRAIGVEGNRMYIVDKNNKIISSSYENDIGQYNNIISDVERNNYGSFISKQNNSSTQVIYYKINNTDWFLVQEIPLQVFSADILSVQKTVLIFFIVSIIIIFFVSTYWLRKITEPLYVLDKAMRDMGKGKFGVTLDKMPNNEIGFIINRFNYMSISISELIKKNEENEKKKMELEIEALQAQINPHFIYNTLNMIKWMAAVIKAKNIMDSIVSLCNILRPIFKDTKTYCNFQEEIDYVNNYIKIINWRYENKINLNVNMPEGLKEVTVPKFILQPIIENSITHGLKELDTMNISITVIEEDNNLIIKVSDTGVGIEKEKLDLIRNKLTNGYNEDSDIHESIGLINVHRRIKLNFGNEYGIAIESSKSGTKVHIKIPKYIIK